MQIKLMKFHVIIFVAITLGSCYNIKNMDRPKIPDNHLGRFHQTEDGSKIFIYDYKPVEDYKATLFIISGVTGINHNLEKDIIEQLSNKKNRVIVIHPRGTGYSDGERGDISDFSLFIDDYVDIIKESEDYNQHKTPLILFGHSMSCAILMAITEQTDHIDGAILVNPPYVLKKAKGMSPGFREYAKYAWYSIFARHKPVVDMAGNPNLIENEQDREEARLRSEDPLLVKYFSIYMMMKARKTMNLLPDYAKKADFPLLLLYGVDDNIVDKKGCDLIYENWKSDEKHYHLIEKGSHGKSTVKLSKEIINNWVSSIRVQ